ncbi:MAG: hypothetical protein GYB58_01705 [Gammaproteobacteria bacterium]|nr:hypothetical protein [Gammaproteobacteria bacterium]
MYSDPFIFSAVYLDGKIYVIGGTMRSPNTF